VGQKLPGIVGLPWLLGLLCGVLLVQTHQQVDQLASNRSDTKLRRQLGQVYQPPRIPARPIIVTSIKDPKDPMVSFADLVQQVADLRRSCSHAVSSVLFIDLSLSGVMWVNVQAPLLCLHSW